MLEKLLPIPSASSRGLAQILEIALEIGKAAARCICPFPSFPILML